MRFLTSLHADYAALPGRGTAGLTGASIFREVLVPESCRGGGA